MRGAVHLVGVRPDNLIIHDHDVWFDVFDNTKANTDLHASREEFFRVLTRPELFRDPSAGAADG